VAVVEEETTVVAVVAVVITGAAVAAEVNLKSAIDRFRYHCKADKLQLISFLFSVTLPCSIANQNLLHASTLITLLNESINSIHAFL
jgi:hypothetical protein